MSTWAGMRPLCCASHGMLRGRADGDGTWQSFMTAPEANLEAVPDGISDQDGAQFAARARATSCAAGAHASCRA